MIIEQGWVFHSADFSVQAGGRVGNAEGCVMLARVPEDVARWHRLPEEVRDVDDGPTIYACGRGFTLEEAVSDANFNAALVGPLPDCQE